MKKLATLLALVFLASLLSMPAVAAGNGDGQVQNNGQVQNGKSQVPQAQIEMIKKREELMKRHDKMLKIRQRLIQTDDPGNTNGQQPVN